MYIKVDYSEDCKAHGCDVYHPLPYAIYTRKHWWNKWVQGSTFADLDYCKREAQSMSELPVYYR